MKGKLLTGALLLSLSLSTFATSSTTKQKVQLFINNMVSQHHFKRDNLEKLLLNLKPNQKIIHSMNTPAESKSWQQYRAIFLKPDRVAQGVDYWKKHQKTIEASAKKYNVDPKVMLGIIGVETKYGKFACTNKVLDSLYTLSFYYPKREKFFQKELSHFLILAKEQHLDPKNVCGSYAGAIGVPQFMPSSYRHYAVDFDKTGSIDLFNSHNDAIASVANYLAKNGWKYKQPIASKAKGKAKILARYKNNSGRKFYRAAVLKKSGIKAADKKSLAQAKKAAVINLPLNSKNNYWLAYPNFRAIMRYNPRIQYAMVVYLLGEEIQQQIDKTTLAALNKSHSKV